MREARLTRHLRALQRRRPDDELRPFGVELSHERAKALGVGLATRREERVAADEALNIVL